MSVPARRGALRPGDDGALVASPSRAASYTRPDARVKQKPPEAPVSWDDPAVWNLGPDPSTPHIQRGRGLVLRALTLQPRGLTAGEIASYVLRSGYSGPEREAVLSSLLADGTLRLTIATITAGQGVSRIYRLAAAAGQKGGRR